jgi:alpha,alpha-trehalase
VYRDAPNAWPPHQYIILQALRAIPTNVTFGNFPKTPNNQSSFSLIPANQLGITETDLPGQPVGVNINASTTGLAADINSNSLAGIQGNWNHILQTALANRYFASVYCSW